MTETRWGRVPEGASSPHVAVVPTLRAASGSTLRVPVRVTNRATAERAIVVTAVGVDPAWLGVPARTLPLAPGASEVVELELTPPQGTLPASYPLVVDALAVDPVTGRTDAASSRPGHAESTLVVSPRSRLTVELEPSDLRAISSKKVTAVLRNTGGADAQVVLKVTHPRHGRVKFRRPTVVVPPDGEVRITGRARINRPRLLGYGARHAFRVTASTPESVRHAQGSLEQRAVFGPWGLKAVAILCVVAVWLGGAGFLVAKISESQREKSQEETAALADAGTDEGGDAAGEEGAGDEGGDDAGEDAGDEGGEDAEGEEPAPPLQLAGTVVDQPGVTVRMESTSLVDEEAQGATGIGVDDEDVDGDGKRPAAAFAVASPSQAPEARSTDTDADGAWAMGNVKAPGYYLLTFSKPGFETQRYVVDSSSEAAKEPLEFEMVPGTGSMRGKVTGPGGAVGGATVTITDGVNTLTTSSTSDGAGAGTWSIDGLSAPGTYVVTATRRDMSSEARVVQLDSFGTATADLRLTAGVALVEGDVTAAGFDGSSKPLGGAMVTVTDGDELTRTATTLTVDPKGRFYLPSLPVPGDYTVTVAATGYQTASISFELERGDSSLRLDPTELESVNGRVDGTMWGLARELTTARTARAVRRADSVPDGATPLAGVGLTLVNPEHSYKTTSSSVTATGGERRSGFAFDVVAPGVYTLTASFFNRITVERTVRVEAGDDGDPMQIVLSELPDGPLPRTSRIEGEVVDVDTGKAIPTCTDGRLTTKAERENCVTATLERTAFSDDFAADGGFLLPNDKTCAPLEAAGQQCGLRPGLYTVEIQAPGYLDRSVRVEVGENRRVTAPLVELIAVPSVTGVVSLAEPDSAEGVTNPTKSCVWLVRATATGGLPACDDAIDLGAANDDAAKDDPDACLPARSVDRNQTGRTRWCAVTETDGTYLIEAPDPGTYRVVAVPANDEFVGGGEAQLILDSGAEQVDFELNRLGRVELAVRQPPGEEDTDGTGRLVDSDQAVVTLQRVDSSVTVETKATTVDGRVTVTRLQPGTYSVSGTSALGTHGGTLPEQVVVGYDDLERAALDLTDPVADFLGQVVGYDVSRPAAQRAVGVTGAAVRVIGGTRFTSSTVDEPGTLDPFAYRFVDVTTNGQGCFSVVKVADDSDPRDATCTGTADARGVMPAPFVTTRMPSVSVTAAGWHPFAQSDYHLQTGRVRNTLTLLPEPLPVATEVTVDGADDAVAGDIAVTVTSTSGRTVGASLDYDAAATASNGTATYDLTWDDQSLLGLGVPAGLDVPDGDEAVAPDHAMPGTYTLTFSNPEIVSNPATTLTCVRGGACTLSDTGLKERGAIAVTVVDGSTVGQPQVNNALVSLELDGTAAGSLRTQPAGPNAFPRLRPGAVASLNVRAPGFGFGDAASSGAVSMTCGDPAAPTDTVTVQAGRTTSCTIVLTRLGTISGTLAAVRTEPGESPSQQYAVANREITATRCTDDDCDTLVADSELSATTNDSGEFTFAGRTEEQEGPRAGFYLLDVPSPPVGFGFGSTTFDQSNRVVEVVDGASATPELRLFAVRVPVEVTLTDQNDQPIVGNTAAKVWLSRTPALVDPAPASDQTASDSDRDGRYTFNGGDGVLPGTWYVKVDGSAIFPLVQSTEVAFADSSGDDTPTVTVAIDVVRNRATLGGVVTEQPRPGIDSPPPVTGATVTLAPDGPSVLTDQNGVYTFADVTAGSYTIEVTQPGFTVTPTPVVLGDGDDETRDLVAAPTLVPTTVVVSGTSETFAGATATLTPRPGTWESPQTFGISATPTPVQVRFGCYDAELTMNSPGDEVHFGRVTGVTTSGGTDPVCGGDGIWVPPEATELTVTFQVDSAPLRWTSVATAQPGHPVPTADSTLRITGGDLDQSQPLSPGSTVYVPAGSYTCTPVLEGVRSEWWDAEPQPCSTGDTPTAFVLEERETTLTITVAGLAADEQAQVQVTSAEPGADPTPVFSGPVGAAGTTLDLPYGAWLVEGVMPDTSGDSETVDITDPDQAYSVELEATAGP